MPLSESVLGNRAFDTEEGRRGRGERVRERERERERERRGGGGGRRERERRGEGGGERERTQNFITQGLRFQAVFLILQSERERVGWGGGIK